MPSDWSWKAKNLPPADGDDAPPPLRYEPGNWGDLLKDACLLEVLDWMGEQGGFAHHDPFAGAPDYPLSPRARDRLAESGLLRLQQAVEPWTARSVWPGSAALAAAHLGRAVAAGDAQPARHAAFAGDPRFLPYPQPDGWETIRAASETETRDGPELWFVDPYDVVAEEAGRQEAVARLSARSPVLLYVYNRAGRSKEALRDYRRFRGRFGDARAAALGGGPPRLWLARVAADAFLPAAWHELIFLPSPTELARPDLPRLLSRLRESTVTLAHAQRRAERWESEE